MLSQTPLGLKEETLLSSQTYKLHKATLRLFLTFVEIVLLYSTYLITNHKLLIKFMKFKFHKLYLHQAGKSVISSAVKMFNKTVNRHNGTEDEPRKKKILFLCETCILLP